MRAVRISRISTASWFTVGTSDSVKVLLEPSSSVSRQMVASPAKDFMYWEEKCA